MLKRKATLRGDHHWAVVSTVGASAMAAVVALTVNVLMSRTLGTEARGYVAWYLQWAYIMAPVLAAGLDRYVLVAEHPSPVRRWLWPSATLGAIGVIAASLATSLIWMLTILIAISGAVVAIERGVGIATRKYWRFVILQVATQIVILFLSIILTLFDEQMETAWLAAYALPVVLIAAFEISRRDGISKSRVSPVELRQAVPLMTGGLALLLAARAERLLLPILSSTAQLGLYVAVATATELIAWGARGLGESRIASLRSGELSGRLHVIKMLRRDLGVLTLLSVPIGCGVWWVLIPLLGPGFDEGRQLVAPLCLSAIGWALCLQVSSAWLGLRGRAASMCFDVACAVVTMGVVVVLIPPFGALGAGLGCAAAYFTLAAVGSVLVIPKSPPRREASRVNSP